MIHNSAKEKRIAPKNDPSIMATLQPMLIRKPAAAALIKHHSALLQKGSEGVHEVIPVAFVVICASIVTCTSSFVVICHELTDVASVCTFCFNASRYRLAQQTLRA